ncbi:Uncharacterized protein DBV15_06560 [Temnothorax longispinosus]|uniref:Uncharacterized protein n=1 Tax=Temnothorax longispinosus TaxID=300112 RepID=A0A4V3S9X2_9HYME|nr:Uncharacterized protein DBV15_06560 [Temnothorax longispinosus]
MLSAGTNFAGAISAPQQLHANFPITGLPGASFGAPTAGGNWIASFAQPKQGYAVREDHGDSTTYDFRTMTVQGTPVIQSAQYCASTSCRSSGTTGVVLAFKNLIAKKF